MAGTDSQIIKGLYDPQHIQDRLRKYAQDKDYFRFWVLRQRLKLTVLKIISEKFGVVPAENIRDWTFKYPEFDEIQSSFYLSEASNSTDATNTKFKVTNEIASRLTTANRLQISGLWQKATVTAGNTDIATAINISSGIVLPEICRIINISTPDYGGAGYSILTVRRGHPADSYTGTAPAVATTYKIEVVNLAVRTNSYPMPPITKNSKGLENLIQISRWSYGLGEMMVQGNGIDTFLAEGTEAHLDINYTLAETYVTKIIEKAVLCGRKSAKDVGQDVEQETGGILEWIMPDTDHILDLGGNLPTPQRMNNLVRRMADTAGVSELWMFTGTEAAESLANQYDGKTIYTIQGELSLRYQMKIYSLESVGRDMIIYHVVAPILNELGMQREAICLNLQEVNFGDKLPFGTFQIAYKVPFEDCPEGEGSFKAGEGFKGILRELYGAWGLVRRVQDTHFRIVGFPTVNN